MYGFRLEPRYTCGSPAWLPDSEHNHELAIEVANSEHRSYGHYMEGAYGEEKRAYAVEKGLDGIVVEGISAQAAGLIRRKHNVRHYRDILTGRIFSRKL